MTLLLPTERSFTNIEKAHKQRTGIKMINLIDTLRMLMRWQREGWEVHP